MPSDSATALEVGDRDAVRCAPKADLHIHGFGVVIGRSYVREPALTLLPLIGFWALMAEMRAFTDEKLSSLFAGTAGAPWRAAAIFAGAS